jgi:IgGFc binding protein
MNLRALCLASGLSLLFALRCSSSGDSGGFGPGSSSGESAGGTSGGVFGSSGDSGQLTGLTCSSDLHQVLGKDGRLVKTCPPELGCAAGQCVAACESAKANKSSIGCDYYAVAPDTIVSNEGGCFAAFVTNTWGSSVKLTADRGGVPLSIAGMGRIPSGSGQAITYAPLLNDELPSGQVAILFLSRSSATACPAGVTPGYTSALANVAGTGLGTGFHITASAPVVAYDIFPYGGGSSALTSATLLLPTTAWDVNYIGVNAYRKSTAVADGNPFLSIIAAEDGTSVTIRPTAAIGSGPGVPGTASGVPATYALSKGQVLQFSQASELTGSAIQATKPIGVFGGASCLSVPVDAIACDAAHQQLPPVSALGNEYVGVRYRNRYDGREESPPWRIVGAVDGTVLTYTPVAPASAPTMLNAGQVAEFNSAGGFVVKSQDTMHPFYMSAHMTGCGFVGGQAGLDCRGDPEFVNVIPSAQWLNSYVFFTDPTYPETNLVVTRAKTASGFKDVELDCAGKLSGWQPIGTDYEYTRTDLVRGNFQRQGSCDNGRHEMKSEGAFGLTVWGWGSAATGAFQSYAVSYAYPAGASIKPINTVVVPAGPK